MKVKVFEDNCNNSFFVIRDGRIVKPDFTVIFRNKNSSRVKRAFLLYDDDIPVHAISTRLLHVDNALFGTYVFSKNVHGVNVTEKEVFYVKLSNDESGFKINAPWWAQCNAIYLEQEVSNAIVREIKMFLFRVACKKIGFTHYGVNIDITKVLSELDKSDTIVVKLDGNYVYGKYVFPFLLMNGKLYSWEYNLFNEVSAFVVVGCTPIDVYLDRLCFKGHTLAYNKPIENSLLVDLYKRNYEKIEQSGLLEIVDIRCDGDRIVINKK